MEVPTTIIPIQSTIEPANISYTSTTAKLTPAATSSVSTTNFAYAYSIVGIGGMIANVFIIIVLLSDRKFLRQSATIAGIAISHLLCSFSIGATGLYRIINQAILAQPVPTWVCLVKVFPALLPFAFQSMGMMLILIGIERLTVFLFPHWYRVKWTFSRSWRLVGLGHIFVLISFGMGLYIAVNQSITTATCTYLGVFGRPYYVYCSTISALGGTIAVGLTVSGLIIGMKQAKKLPLLSGEAGRNRRQVKLTRSMLSVAVCDFCLVVIPNVLYLISFFAPNAFPALSGSFSSYTIAAYCVNTMMSFIPYLAFNQVFRMNVLKIIGRKKHVQGQQLSKVRSSKAGGPSNEVRAGVL